MSHSSEQSDQHKEQLVSVSASSKEVYHYLEQMILQAVLCRAGTVIQK